MRNILKSFAEDLVKEARVIMQDIGINDKVGINTLVDSDLYRQIEFEVTDDGEVKLKFNYYIEYVNDGRKAGRWPPISAIIKWIEKKHIVSTNKNVRTTQQLAYLFARSIYQKGISPRPILDLLFESSEDVFERHCEKIFDYLTKELDDYFNK